MPLLRFPIRIWRSSRDQGGESTQTLLRESAECEHNESTDDIDALSDRQLVSVDMNDCQLRMDADSAAPQHESEQLTNNRQHGMSDLGHDHSPGQTQESSDQPLTVQPPDGQLARPMRSPLPFPEITRFAPGSSRHTMEYLAQRRGLSRLSKKRDKHIVTLFMSIICLLLLCAAAVEPRWINWSGTSECSNNQQFYIGLTDALLQNTVGNEQSCFMTIKLLVLLNVTTAFLTVTFIIVLCAIALELAKPANPFLRTARRNSFCTVFAAILASVVNAVAYVASETLRVRIIETTPRNELDVLVHVQVTFTTGFYLVAAAATCAIIQTAYVLLLSTALRRCASRCARRVRNGNAVRRRRPSNASAHPTSTSATSASRATSLTRSGAFNRSFYLRDPRSRLVRSAAELLADAPPPFTRYGNLSSTRPTSSRTGQSQSANDDEPMLVLSSECPAESDATSARLVDVDATVVTEGNAAVPQPAQSNSSEVLRVLLGRLTPPPAYAP